MSQENRRRRSTKKKPEGLPKRKIFTKATISKIFLPSLVLVGIILGPVIFEAIKTRHQAVDDVVPAPVGSDWFDNLFQGGAGGIGGDPNDPDDTNNTSPDGFLDGFTNGLSVDPLTELFRVTPNDHYFNWRLEVYDTYTNDDWEEDITTNTIIGYTGAAPGDGELTVTTNVSYVGGSSIRNYPSPYHYIDGEVFSDDYSFDPDSEWDESQTTLEEDMYGCKTINSRFIYSYGNSTLTYPVSYTLQDNDYIRDNSGGYTLLNSLISSNPELSSRYLQIPFNYTLEAPITNQIASSLYDNSLTIYQQAFRNLLYLSSNFTFDLYMLLGLSEDSPTEGEDHVEWFMNRERGTSAHFASALAMLCRLQGIPSRIAVGFSYGERDGSDFIIRAVDVHSWTEIFIPINGVGRWVQFDSAPLPPIAPPPYDTFVIRDRYGENTIGFQSTFHCSNEFFFEDQHFNRTSLAPNPSSDAWYYYIPTSSWYGPYVNRSQTFTLYSFLGNGNENDFYLYLQDGDLRGLVPIEGEEIFFIDITSGETLGSAFTNSSGYATFDYSYNNSAITGLHIIEADWSGIRAPTYDLRFYPTEIATGVIVTGSVNVTSIDPEIIKYFELSTSLEDSNIPLIKVISKVELSQDIWYLRLIRNIGVLPEIISFFRSN